MGNMTIAEKSRGIEPIPRYVMPDASIPEYDEILEQLQEYQRSLIGSSYYYIRMENDRMFLCRILPGGGKIFYHEIVDHEKHGISEDDLEEAEEELQKLTDREIHQVEVIGERKQKEIMEV